MSTFRSSCKLFGLLLASLLCLSLLAGCPPGQKGPRTWHKTYLSTNLYAPSGNDLEETRDGGFAIVGKTRCSDRDSGYFLEIDSHGEIRFENLISLRQFAFDYHEQINASFVEKLTSGEWVVAASWNGNDYFCGSWDCSGSVGLVKLGAPTAPPQPYVGWLYPIPNVWKQIIWDLDRQQAGPCQTLTTLLSMKATRDGGVILAARIFAAGNVLAKTNADGEVQWYSSGHCIGAGPDVIQQTADGGFILICSVTANETGSILVTKIDNAGNELWQKSYGEEEGTSSTAILQTSDGEFIILGRIAYVPSLLKLNGSGDLLWQRPLPASASAIGLTSDGGFILAGVSSSDVFLARTDSQGQVLWQKMFGSCASDVPRVVRQTSDGGFVVLASPPIVTVIRTNSEGNVQGDVAVPDLTGQDQDSAQQAIAGCGLTISVEEKHSDTVEEGFVMFQQPAPGTYTPAGSRVYLELSLGPETPEDPTLSCWITGCTSYQWSVTGEDFSNVSSDVHNVYNNLGQISQQYGDVLCLNTGRSYNFNCSIQRDGMGCISSLTMTVSGGLLPAPQTVNTYAQTDSKGTETEGLSFTADAGVDEACCSDTM